MLTLLKRNKKEQLGFDLQNPENQKAVIKAALDHKIPLINKGYGVFMVDMKRAKGDRLSNFLTQFTETSVDCKQGVIDKDDPKYDYILIYDVTKED